MVLGVGSSWSVVLVKEVCSSSRHRKLNVPATSGYSWRTSRPCVMLAVLVFVLMATQVQSSSFLPSSCRYTTHTWTTTSNPASLSLRFSRYGSDSSSCSMLMMMKNYFAIGSNLQPTTMTSLRNLRPLPNATAAVLPGYQLAFNIAGLPGIEPSAAAAHRCKDDDDSSSSSTSPCLLHGALYTLTESDFETLSLSEGVRPGSSDGAGVGYRWESCRVVPYIGDNQEAGATALQQDRKSVV